MHPLDRKLFRDLWRLRGQVLAIGLVMASGIGLLVMSLTSIDALRETATAYYERYRFAHVFAKVERAPERLVARIRRIPGVQTVQTRVARSAILDIDGFEEPVMGQLVSVPERGEPVLNALALRSGRYPRAGSPDEVVLSEPFAEAHGLRPGARLRAIVNGHWRDLRVVGLALSPEYVYTIGPGALMPDDRRFGILFMGREALQGAFDLKGAFDDVSLRLLRGADVAAVIERLDRLLAPYGGTGAYERKDQLSNWFLMNEIAQHEAMARILPTVFLAVAAFLTHMVFARLIAVERSEIGLLKAFGYRDRDVAWHYTKMVLAISAVGILLGWLLGAVLGRYHTALYADFFRFPFLLYRPGPQPFLAGALVSAAAALVGALGAVRAAALLPPAEAMRPPSPPLFRRSGLGRAVALDQPTRIVLRQIGRWPGRAFLTSAGIGMAVAVLVTSLQWLDAIGHMVDVYFDQAQVQDLSVGLAERRSYDALRGLQRLPGVQSAEPLRLVSAKLRAGHRVRREAVQGVPARQELFRVYDTGGRALTLPAEGLVLSSELARVLQVGRGDAVTIEVLEGDRPVLRARVAELFETYFGTPAYMEIGALNRLMGDSRTLDAAHLRIDDSQRAQLFRALKQIPQVSAVTVKAAAIDSFHDTLAETLYIFVAFFTAFACALAFGVTYNSARVALSERGRELATLRVLGFTRAEISYILLGEVALLTLIALPLGCMFGALLAGLMSSAFSTELYRVPPIIEASTYAWAMLVGIAATAASALLVRRRLDRLDLIAVLKTRE